LIAVASHAQVLGSIRLVGLPLTYLLLTYFERERERGVLLLMMQLNISHSFIHIQSVLFVFE
jgi:hypothetical protein